MNSDERKKEPVGLGVIITCLKVTPGFQIAEYQFKNIGIFEPKSGHIRSLEWALSSNPDHKDEKVVEVLSEYFRYLVKYEEETFNRCFESWSRRVPDQLKILYGDVLSPLGYEFPKDN